MPFIRRKPDEPSLPVGDEKWAQATLKDVLFAAYQEQRRARLWRNIWRGVFVLIFLAIMAGSRGGNGNARPNAAGNKFVNMQKPHTAVVELKGVIGGNDEHDQVQILREGMETAYKNSNVKAILLRANSPGGSPVVSNIAFEEIRRMKREHANIPVYVVAEDMCASGCYYIAAAADKIYADPSSLMGSIGVIGSSFDVTELMQKLGVKRRVRIAGDNKGMGDPFTPESPAQQEIFQQMLNQVHAEFIKSVRDGRKGKLNEQGYPDLFSGRVFTGIEAKKAGLVDDFGNIYSVARDVVKAPELVDYTPESNDLASLLQRGLGAKVQLKLEEWFSPSW